MGMLKPAMLLVLAVSFVGESFAVSGPCDEAQSIVDRREKEALRFQVGQLSDQEKIKTYKHEVSRVYRCQEVVGLAGELAKQEDLDVCVVEFTNWKSVGFFKEVWQQNEAVFIQERLSGFVSRDSFYSDYQPVYMNKQLGYYLDNFEKVNEVPLKYTQFLFDPSQGYVEGRRFKAKMFGADILELGFQANCSLVHGW